jgi:lipopolysaccharide biosynthesis glycosyltransferase
MDETIHVVFAANEAYGPYCAAAIRSVCCTAQPRSRVFAHVLTSGFQRHTADMVMRAAHDNGGRASIHLVDLGTVSKLPTLNHISTDTYSRIIAPDVLPNVSRMVYHDCDLVVLDDIGILSDLPLNGCVVGGVNHRDSTLGQEFVTRYGLRESTQRYMNAGVLVIDAAAWRKEAAGTAILRWMHANADRLAYSDQDAINHHFQGRIADLPLRWNVESHLFAARFNGQHCGPDVQIALADPAIIHYTGTLKPWCFASHVPCRERYLEHLDAVLNGTGFPGVQRTRRIRNAVAAAVKAVRFRVGKARRWLRGQELVSVARGQ